MPSLLESTTGAARASAASTCNHCHSRLRIHHRCQSCAESHRGENGHLGHDQKSCLVLETMRITLLDEYHNYREMDEDDNTVESHLEVKICEGLFYVKCVN